MKTVDQAQKLVELLSEYPEGLCQTRIMRSLHIGSERTFFRVIGAARNTLNCQIDFTNNYYILNSNYEYSKGLSPILPHDDEFIALVTIQHILSGMASGVLKQFFEPVRKRMDTLIKTFTKKPEKWIHKIRILDIHYRKIEEGIFTQIANSIARERVLQFDYTNSDGKKSSRTVSPLHIVRYKDNWYLDAWCHNTGSLRIFSLDSIQNLRNGNHKFIDPDENTIHEIYATSYGIFTGKPTNIAKLIFREKAALYVKREIWHQEQKLTEREDSSVILEIPYNKSTELVREILSWGKNVEVLEPKELRYEVAKSIEEVCRIYENDL